MAVHGQVCFECGDSGCKWDGFEYKGGSVDAVFKVAFPILGGFQVTHTLVTSRSDRAIFAILSSERG